MSECFIRGSIIKYLRIPEDVIDKVKEDMQVSRMRNRDIGGRGSVGGNRNKFRGNMVLHIYRENVANQIPNIIETYKYNCR